MSTITYAVSDISSDGEVAISAKVGALPGVDRVEVRLESRQVAVTGRDLDGGAIHDAIHEAGYGARRVIELAEPYIARPIAALGTWRHGDWRLKKYTIAYARQAARLELVEAAEAVAADTLPTPAVTPTRYGVGFLGIHDGRGAPPSSLDRRASGTALSNQSEIQTENPTTRPRWRRFLRSSAYV